MKDVLIEGESLNKQGWSVWIEISGGSSALAIPLNVVTRGDETAENVVVDRHDLTPERTSH